MQPERRLIDHLDDQRRADHDEAGYQDHEDRRSVAGVRERIIETAFRALLAHIEKPGKERAFAAARTAPGKAGHDRLHQRRLVHGVSLSPPTRGTKEKRGGRTAAPKAGMCQIQCAAAATWGPPPQT